MAKSEYEKKQEMDAHNEQVRRRMHGLDERTGRPIEKPPSGGGGSSCFPKGTLVATPYGLSDISTLKEGDHVIAFGRDNDALRVRRILRKMSHGRSRLWTIHFSDGTSLRTTSVHCFRVENQWVKAFNLSPGATVTCVGDGKLGSKVVVRSEASQEFEPVFNLIVEGDFTFIADGVLAHSFSHFRGLRTLAWLLIEALKRSSQLARVERWC
jgi:hypothetical protein